MSTNLVVTNPISSTAQDVQDGTTNSSLAISSGNIGIGKTGPILPLDISSGHLRTYTTEADVLNLTTSEAYASNPFMLTGTSKYSKTRFVIASEAKQSRVFAKNYGRLPRRYAPRNDI
jgi:hypothetical protein